MSAGAAQLLRKACRPACSAILGALLPQPPTHSLVQFSLPVAGLGTAFVLYMSVAITSYMALGNTVPGDVMTGFTTAPVWVGMLANAMVLLHMVAAVQVRGARAGIRRHHSHPAPANKVVDAAPLAAGQLPGSATVVPQHAGMPLPMRTPTHHPSLLMQPPPAPSPPCCPPRLQMFSQPIYQAVEAGLCSKWPKLMATKRKPVRLVYRSINMAVGGAKPCSVCGAGHQTRSWVAVQASSRVPCTLLCCPQPPSASTSSPLVLRAGRHWHRHGPAILCSDQWAHRCHHLLPSQ